MKAGPFRYLAPDSLEQVIEALAGEEDSRIIAGGQSLVPMMAMRLARPELLVDLRNVASLRTIDIDDGRARVGAMVTQTELGARADVHPLLLEAIPLIAHAQIRNRGTVVGSLAHADPAAELPAVAVALDTQVDVRGPDAERTLPARELFTSYLTTDLGPGEVATSCEFPAATPGEGWAIMEVARRRGDFALAGVVARLVLDADGVVRAATVVPFAVSSRPVASDGAEQLLIGNKASADALLEAAQFVASELDPPSDVHATSRYRRRAVAVLAERSLARARAGALERAV